MGKDVPKSADDYDVVVRELAFERRGKPTDRMKSEEEMAREEKERLEKLEVDSYILTLVSFMCTYSISHIKPPPV